jgi:hypothetical protein
VSAEAADPAVAGQLMDAYRARHPRAQRGRLPAAAADPAHLTDVQPRLGHQRSARVLLGARSADRPA